MTRFIPTMLLATSVLALGACRDNRSERWEFVPATIIFHTARGPGIPSGPRSSVVIPLESTIGKPTQVVITSFGGGCNRFGKSTVELGDHVARIRVFDKERAANGEIVCTTELKHFAHRVSLVFPKAGIWRVEIIGISKGKGFHQGRPITIEASVSVK